jgi:hypothetical protein
VRGVAQAGAFAELVAVLAQCAQPVALVGGAGRIDRQLRGSGGSRGDRDRLLAEAVQDGAAGALVEDTALDAADAREGGDRAVRGARRTRGDGVLLGSVDHDRDCDQCTQCEEDRRDNHAASGSSDGGHA